MIGDLLNTYKYGWKTSYYQNTYDYKEDPSDMDEPAHSIGWRDDQPEVQPATLATDEDDEFCDACAI
jgi:ribonucleoside-diphosphate reductase alpha chain